VPYVMAMGGSDEAEGRLGDSHQVADQRIGFRCPKPVW
jgi:hypothetical protein